MLKTKTFKSINSPVDEDFEGWQIEMKENLEEHEKLEIADIHYATTDQESVGRIAHHMLVVYIVHDLKELKEQQKKKSSPIDQPGVHPNQNKLIT